MIPESLREQLEEFRGQLWRRKVVESVAAGLIGLLVSFLLIFGLDRVWQTPGWARLLILAGGASLFVGFAPYWLHRWIWGHRREDQLARLIAKKFPGLGDRLLGVIELQKEEGSEETLSPGLRAAAMEVVSLEARKRKFDKALPAPRHRKWALAALSLMVVVAAAFVVAPEAGSNALERWLNPFAPVERYTFTQLENPPRFMAVPYGEAFDISLLLAKRSEQKPDKAVARYDVQPEVTARRRGRSYDFKFQGQQEKGTVSVRIGDLRHKIDVRPVRRPEVTETSVVVRPPKYLGIPERTVDLGVGEIGAVEGSELVFELVTNREIAKGRYGPSEISGEMAQADKFEPVEGLLEIESRKSRTDVIGVGTVPFSIPFEWSDRYGLRGGQEFKLRVDARRDQAPMAYTQGTSRQIAILPEEVLDFEILCEDDYGLRMAGIEWSGVGTAPGEKSSGKDEMIVAKGGPESRRIAEPVAFSPAAFGIGPQRLLLRSFAEDYYPGRGRVYSQPVMIYVLSREEHAQFLKSRFDRTIGELEDLARRELELLDENRRLERLEGEELQDEANRKRIEDQEREEGETEERMEALKEQMEELMKDAARNGDIDKETLKKMAEALKMMQDLSGKEIPEVGEKLKEAGEPSNTPGKTEEDMKKAVEEQEEVVEKMKEALEKANDANERFEASTFVARLKKAAGEQKGIAAALVARFEEILGMRQPAVDPADQRALNGASRQQMATASDIRWIQEDLGHYHARTGDESFKEILDLMRETKIDLGLEKIRQKLGENHSYEATEEASEWAEKLEEWAKTLGDELDKGAGGGGGGSGAPNSEDEDFEFMLRVMKMIQTQQDLRARTRVLEQLKREAGISPE